MTRMVFWSVLANVLAWAMRRACRHAGAASMFIVWYAPPEIAAAFLRGNMRRALARETRRGVETVFAKMAKAAV